APALLLGGAEEELDVRVREEQRARQVDAVQSLRVALALPEQGARVEVVGVERLVLEREAAPAGELGLDVRRGHRAPQRAPEAGPRVEPGELRARRPRLDRDAEAAVALEREPGDALLDAQVAHDLA